MSKAWKVPDLEPKATLAVNARRILTVRVAELFSYAPIIADSEAIEQLHDARISAKRLRYTLELFPSVFGEQGDQAIEQMKGLQEELGLVHDLDVRIDLIEKKIKAGADGSISDEVLDGLRLLLDRQRIARARHHSVVVRRWRKLEQSDFQSNLSMKSAS